MPAIDQFARNRAPVVIVDNRAETLPHDADDAAHNATTIERAYRFNGSARVAYVEVHLNPRGVYASEPLWLENVIVVVGHDGTRLVIGAIQREPGAKTEFHS